MKYILIFVLIVVLILMGYGYYLENSEDETGQIFIGSGVLVVAFILMPLFIYHRYKNKDIKNFKITNFTKEEKEKFDI